MKVFLTVKNQCFLAAGLILGVAGFGPKGRIPAFLQCFCCFSSKVQKLAKPIFTDVGCSFFGNPIQKKSHSDWKFTRFSDFQKKRACFQSPFWSGGGGVKQSPKRHKKGPIPAFLRCFLVLHKIKKRASQPALKRPSWELFGAPSPKERHFTCIFTVFSHLDKQKTCIFTWFWGFETPAESNQGPKEREKNTILPAFLQGFGVSGEKVKG